MQIKDTQKSSYRELMHERIPSIISGSGTTFANGSELTFKPMDSNNSILIKGEDGTEYYSVKAICTLTNEGEAVEFIADLLHVPALQELGFKIKGNYMQRLDEYERSKGWSFFATDKGDYAKLLAENNRSISFVYDKSEIPYVSFSIRGTSKTKVGLATFLVAVSGYTVDELVNIFGYSNPYVIEIFSENAAVRMGDNVNSRADAVRAVAHAMFGDTESNPRTTSVILKEINDNLFSSKFFPMGYSNAKRLNYLQSYGYRANGRVLAESVECNGYSFEKGVVLSNNELAILDLLPINSLKIEYHGKVYDLRKFSNFTFRVLGCVLGEDLPELGLKAGQKLDIADVHKLNDSNLTCITLKDGSSVARRVHATTLSLEDLLTAFSIWTDNLNGYELHAKQYEVTNRVIVPFDKAIEDLLSKHLHTIINNIHSNIKLADFNNGLMVNIKKCCDGIEPDYFIQSVTSTKKNSGQMSDMCNLLSFVSKSNKATSQVPSDAVTPDMVSVQDLQEGRLDPLDVPESDKIGRVHYRTMLSKLNEEGELVAPFLRVANGEVLSEEPVYLTAIEEADQFIAEWNETFKEDDGTLKKRVKTRCNGNVQTVELSRVCYKEFSPYQNLSPAHSMIPFPGHSNGKRITMGCNQEKQAVPLVKKDRPASCSGGESLLDVGVYTGRDILEEFYESNRFVKALDKAFVMKCNIKLTGTTTQQGSKTLHFTILGISEPNTVSFTVPYLFRNFESAMFSYNINPMKDNIYRPEDVVCFNNGYSLEKKDIVTCVDFGAQKVDMGIFDRGIALVKNLNIAYKTHDGSTIEDGILISDRLVYDDELTHIGMFEVKEVLSSGENIVESFGISVDSPQYLETNGLPKIGTELKGGMPVIGKISFSNQKSFMRYVRVPTYVSGQVVSADIRQTYKGTEATVIIAQRSYIQSGDKMAGRCGNKGVIAKVVPYSDMPYVKDTGFVADVVLNPLGIPSRQNITQLLEAALSAAMQIDGKIAITTPYNENDIDFVREQAKSHDVTPKIMIDGRTGQEFLRPINWGVLPMYKLHHVSKRKIHSVGMDAKLDSTFLQPMKGSKQRGGQSFGEMETWCLEAAGATTFLQDLFSFQSDDAIERDKFTTKVRLGEKAQAEGTNDNDLAMQACYRSFGVEFTSNTDEQCYEFHPLTDEIIRSFSPQPVSAESALHSPAIFGNVNKLEGKIVARRKWGWIDLHTKMVLPLWIHKGLLPNVLGLSAQRIQKLIEGEMYMNLGVQSSISLVSQEDMQVFSDTEKEQYATGMAALVYALENFNTTLCEIECKAKIEEYKKKYQDYAKKQSYKDLLKRYRVLRDFNQGGDKLVDYVVTSYPVMPQTYRPAIHVSGRQMVPDFDWYYTQILHAAEEVRQNNNNLSVYNLYEKLRAFAGLGEQNNSTQKYQNILNYFAGKGRNSHGKIRENMQSKRVMCSGRAAIKPAEDITRTPLELGVPFTMVVKMWFDQLYGKYREVSMKQPLPVQDFEFLLMALAQRDFTEFKRIYAEHYTGVFQYQDANDAYCKMTEEIKQFMKTAVVTAGRQPSLHKCSIRAFTPYVVYDYMIHIHPLVCTGYNADFDGDQMYITAALTDAAKSDALSKLSPASDYILPKDSSVVLEHTQDIVLGVYCATMLKDNSSTCAYNVSDVFFSTSPNSVLQDVLCGNLNPWDLVALKYEGRRYISTAGRIAFNSFIPYGFTEKPFTNTLKLQGVQAEHYCDLAYDGIIGSGKLDKAGMQYFGLQNVCKEVFERSQSECIKVFQAISEYGFRMSDKYGVSLSLQDFDIQSNKEQLLAEADALKSAVEQDYQDGLISEQDKRNAIISIYAGDKSGVNNKIISDICANLPRNNNIFIMMDSGARGNKSQLMHMCGSIGVLQKTKTEDLETAVTSNYYKGLGSFDVHLASYSARTGVASTQNETRNAGYATRQVVYMASGIQIVEDDCGKETWDFEVEWGNHNDSLDALIPSEKWFRENLLGRELADNCSKALASIAENGILTLNSFEQLKTMNGIHEFALKDGVKTISIYDAKNKRVIDEESKHLLKFISDGKLTVSGFQALLNKKVKTFETEDGVYTLRYDMDVCCKSMLNMRVARNLPFLKKVVDPNNGHTVEVMTDETIAYVEKMGLDCIEVRTVLDCHSKHGICARCFGLDYSKLKIPLVGTYVGTESAQSIGEPAAQLTMNVINKGGVSGASSISSGVDVFEALLRGGLPRSENGGAVVAQRSGYLKVDKMDNSVVLRIEPDSINSVMCQKCISANGVIRCPMEEQFGDCECHCQLPEKYAFQNLILKDGEWVDSGEAITIGMIHPESVNSVRGDDDPNRVHTKRQRIWIHNYFDTFRGSGVLINARHFELIANVQNKYVTVLDAGDTNLELGKVYEYNEVRDKLDDIIIEQFVCKKEEAILWNSGAFAALSFEDIASVAANLVTKGYKSSQTHNHSLIGSLSVGETMNDRKMKIIHKPNVINFAEKREKVAEKTAFDINIQILENEETDTFSLDDIDLTSMLISEPVVTTKVTSFETVLPEHTMEPVVEEIEPKQNTETSEVYKEEIAVDKVSSF